jgi:hypothetical protein
MWVEKRYGTMISSRTGRNGQLISRFLPIYYAYGILPSLLMWDCHPRQRDSCQKGIAFKRHRFCIRCWQQIASPPLAARNDKVRGTGVRVKRDGGTEIL